MGAPTAWGAGTVGLVGEVLKECRESEPKSSPPAMFLDCS